MVFLNGDGIPEPGRRGEAVFDDSFVIAFNASEKTIPFTIPDEVYGEGWVVVLDTHDDRRAASRSSTTRRRSCRASSSRSRGRSAVVLRKPRNR